MLQQNFMMTITDQIKKNRSSKTKNEGLLENAQVIHAAAKSAVEESYNPGLAFSVYTMAKEAKKKDEKKLTLTTESFSMNKVKLKLEKDVQYFNYLFENFVHPELKSQYSGLLESIFEDTIRLYQECDVTPRVISPALNSQELTESQVIDLYKNGLNLAIKNNYTKPLLSGQVQELHESTLKTLVRKVVEEGAEMDMESVSIYLPFEETMYNYNKSILIPELARTRIQAFVESTEAEYKDLFEDNAADILKDLEKKIKLLTALVAPGTFDAVVDSDVDGSKMAGVTIISDTNFNDPEEPSVCPASLSSDPEASDEMAAEEEAMDTDDEFESDLDDGPQDDNPGMDEIDFDPELSPEEISDLDDEVEAIEAADGEGLVGDDSTDEPDEGEESDDYIGDPDLPGDHDDDADDMEGSADVDTDDLDADDEVNSDEPDEDDEEDELVEDKKD